MKAKQKAVEDCVNNIVDYFKFDMEVRLQEEDYVFLNREVTEALKTQKEEYEKKIKELEKDRDFAGDIMIKVQKENAKLKKQLERLR